MKNDLNYKKMNDDFQAFMNANEVAPPRALTEQIFRKIREDLNPSIRKLLSKLILIQIIVGSFSLLICSQFGLGPGPLVHTFMVFGHTVCMALCGGLYLGAGAIAALTLLSPAEVELIRRTGYLPLLAVGILSLGTFFGFGAEIVMGFALAWLFGAFLSALVVVETGYRIRRLV